jgi:ribosomal protein S12 methylthiotransferase accessory factor YcaO
MPLHLSTAQPSRFSDRDREPVDDGALIPVLDPGLGVFASVESLAAGPSELPVAVRGRLVGPVFAWPREVYGRGARGDQAVTSVVGAAFETLARDGLPANRLLPAIRMGRGERAMLDAKTVRERASWGCGPDLAAAGEHAVLEAWERRAVARAWAERRAEARLDDSGEPTRVARVLDWHRAQGRRVSSLVLERAPPVVACVAVPHDPDAPALCGVAAGRTVAAAWQAAAAELHQVHLTRCLGARTGELRGRHGRLIAGRVLGLGRDHAIDREQLAALVAATRRAAAPSSLAASSQPIDAHAIEVTPPIAARFGRKVVAVVLAGE